jgi:hypothetical protein
MATIKPTARGIQIGYNTHHQLHDIMFVSLRTMNAIAKSGKKPIPL